MKFSTPNVNRRLLYIGGGAALAMAAATYTLIGSGDKSEDVAHSAPAAGEHAVTAPSTRTAKPSGTMRAPAIKTAAVSKAVVTTAMPGQSQPPRDTAPDVPGDELLQRTKYTYRSLGRTDPFYPLVAGPMASTRFNGDEIDPEVIRLVGIMEDKEGGRRALVEDARGFGYVLRQGDRVLRGKVTRVAADVVTIRHSLYGVTETLTLQLHSKRNGRGQGGFLDDKIR